MAGSISALLPEFQPWAHALVDAAGTAGLQPRVTSTLRSTAEQTRLYRRFMEGLAQYPAAPPGHSAHEYGYALDIVLTPMDALYDLGDLWLRTGGIWSEKDVIHFEYPGFVVPESVRNPIKDTVRTWAEWLNSLPWYVQVLLPAATANMPADMPVTQSYVDKLLKSMGY